MRCGCPHCEAYMIQSETDGMACVCPSCGYRCNACLGTGTVLSREQLVEAAWGPEFVGETSSITVFIKKLRAKIEDDPTEPRIIETVWGIGYRLDPEACG